MQVLSEKIPGYALASTCVALGGILNGYVLKATVLSSDTFRSWSMNLVKACKVDSYERAALSISTTRRDSTSTDDALMCLV